MPARMSDQHGEDNCPYSFGDSIPEEGFQHGDEEQHNTKLPQFAADKEQQVVGPVQDVEEAELDEPASGLMPSGIQVDQSRIADELIGANGAAGRKETENGYHSRGQSLEPRVNRNRGSIRLNRIFEQHV